MFDYKKTLAWLRRGLLDPKGAWAAYAAENNTWRATGLYLTVPLVVASVVVAFALSAVFGRGLGLIGSIRLLLALLVDFAAAAWLFSFFAGRFGGRMSFDGGLAAVTFALMPALVGRALLPLPLIGWLLSIGLAIYGLVLLYQDQPVFLSVPEDKRRIHFAASFITCFVVGMIVGAVFGVSGAAPRDFAEVAPSSESASFMLFGANAEPAARAIEAAEHSRELNVRFEDQLKDLL